MRIQFRGLEGKTLAKARKLYRGYIQEGLSEAYARRKASGLARGKTLAVARGHKEERLKLGVRAYQPSPKGRLDKKKEAWAVYSYVDAILPGGWDDSASPFSMTTYDVTKTLFKNYDAEPLFAMHQYFERQIQNYLKMNIDLSSKEEIMVEENNDSEKGRWHRAFKWQLTDFDGQIRYFIIYEKGNIIERDMWFGFDLLQFKLEIREQGVWE